MYYDEENWNAVEGEEKVGFLEKVNPIGNKHKVSPQTTQVHWRTLDFYKGLALIRVSDSLWPNKKLRIYYLVEFNSDSLYRLNGTSPPIHEVNGKGFINITEANVLEYLRFFCFFVRGEEGQPCPVSTCRKRQTRELPTMPRTTPPCGIGCS